MATQSASAVAITGGTITGLGTPSGSTDAATKGYVDGLINSPMTFGGSLDCSTNPNYPAANAGALYVVSVAGKIGGASGVSVDVGDSFLAKTTNAGGTQASVGTSWSILEHNLQGALLSANNLSDIASASSARTSLGLVIGTDVLAPTGNGSSLTGLTNTQISGLGTMSTQASSSVSISGGTITGITDLAVTDGGTGASSASGARTNLGLVIGTDVLAPSGSGASLTGLTSTQVGLGSVTNDAQTKASVVPNTVPSAGQLHVGNAGGTAFGVVSLSGDAAIASTGAITLTNGAGTRTNLGLGSIATQAASSVTITGGSVTGITDLAVADGGTGASDAATARTNLGVAIGSNVQAYNSDLAAIAALTPTNDDIIQRKAGAWVNRTIAQLSADLGIAAGYQPLDSDLTAIAALTTTSYGRSVLALADAAALRTLGGLGTISTQASNSVSITGGSITGITDLAVADGGTGASDAPTARTNLGLGSIATQSSSSVSISGGTISGASVTGLGTPSASGDAATKGYVDGLVTSPMNFKGATDCSANPNYPAATIGDTYVVSVAGKIGGASGTVVDIGDLYLAKSTNAGGTQAAVGTSWAVIEHNLQGALLSANNLSDVASASTALSNLGGQPLSTSLTNLAGMTVTGTNKVPLATSTGTWSNTSMTSIGQNILGATTAAAVRTQAGTVIGTDVQAFSAQLTSAAGVGDGIVAHTAANTFTPRTITGTTNVITVTNGDGVAGNPTLTVGSLVQRTDTAAVLTAQQNFGAAALTSSAASIAWNLATAQSASHTFTENTTLANPTNMVNGGTYVLRLTQHASSPKTLAFGSAYKWSGGAPTISSTNGAVDILTFISDGTNMYGSILKAFA